MSVQADPATTRWTKPRIGIAALMAILALVIAVFSVHLATCDEDSCVVWVCSVMGNGECGPDTPAILIGS